VKKPPIVIPKTRTVKLGEGATLTQQRLNVEIEKQGLSDIRFFMAGIVEDETRVQVEMGNPPSLLTVDNKTNKPIEDIQVRATVLFGVTLAIEAMQMIEREVQRAISGMLLIDTGATLNASNWHWLFVARGKGAVQISGQVPSFNQGDLLVYYPFSVPHAGWANWMAKKEKGKGFIAQATAAVRKSPVFKQFAVYGIFSSAHSVPGNDYPHGTPMIVVRPRIRAK